MRFYSLQQPSRPFLFSSARLPHACACAHTNVQPRPGGTDWNTLVAAAPPTHHSPCRSFCRSPGDPIPPPLLLFLTPPVPIGSLASCWREGIASKLLTERQRRAYP
eukprot:6176675-Pleurochrysis_carterae.AAC.2